MSSFQDVPVEVLLDHLFPSIPTLDLLHLGSTCRSLNRLTNDDLLWKRKLKEFNFAVDDTARTSGWKLIYRGLSRPGVFVWGEKTNGRLGLRDLPTAAFGHVPFPVELKITHTSIVSLAAGGMSFHALDTFGHVYVWGTLNGTAGALRSDGFSEPGKPAPTPLKLQLPAAMRTISCGRLHAMTLDEHGIPWLFTSWGRPLRLKTSVLDSTSPDSTPIQVECGWAFSAVLTQTGNVHVFWPSYGETGNMIRALGTTMDTAAMDDPSLRAHATSDGIIPCVTRDTSVYMLLLPSIPVGSLPDLHPGEEEDGDGHGGSLDTCLVRIAGLDGHLIGLTNKGHVLKFGHLDNMQTAFTGSWEYLPFFSEVEKVRQHPAFLAREGYTPIEAPRQMHVTHVSANFEHFVAYSTGSSSIVMMGRLETDPESQPIIIPELQNQSVISVVIGDYHYGALTSTGKLYTWGQYAKGALGLGDPTKIEASKPGGYPEERHRQEAAHARRLPPPVTVPAEVRFDHGSKKFRESFCFGITAAGWHMGALVMDLDEDDEEEDEDFMEKRSPSERMPGHFSISPANTLPSESPGEIARYPVRGMGALRIGFAGRGMNRGGFGM